MKRRKLASVALLVVLLLGAGIVWVIRRENSRVLAQSGGGFQAQAALQDTLGGMGPYGQAEQTSTSSSANIQAVTDWNNYVSARCGWSLSTSDVNRIGTADWNMRQAGAPSITAKQLANAATQLINSTLATMTASQQQSLYSQDVSQLVPSGLLYSLNQPSSYVSATQNSNGTWTVAVSSAAFSDRKSFFQQQSPGMVSSYSNFYPAEAALVFYSLASGDMGYDATFENSMAQIISGVTGTTLTNQNLYGDNGYLFRRPLNIFLTESAMSQFFSNLGF